ncbi:MAG: PCRF domain-containing protein, partial [Chloroflexota bacterium]
MDEIDKHYQELEEQMAEPLVASDLKRLQALAKERSAISDVAAKYREYKLKSRSLEETRAMLDEQLDEEMAVLVKQEIGKLEAEQANLQEELTLALLTKDPNDKKNIIFEIRAGTGGEEASL